MGDNQSFNTNVLTDFVSSAMTATTKEDIMAHLERASRAFGMECFAISGLPTANERIDPYVILEGWPDGWFERYAEKNYVHLDPVIYHTKTHDSGFVWSEVFKDRKLSRPAKMVMNGATEYRMLDGFSVPIHGVAGFHAIVTFGTEKVDLSEEARGTLEIIAQYAHNRLKRTILEANHKAEREQLHLTSREQEVLRWCAAGKTQWEIGQILSLSGRTIQFYMANLQQKLKVVNSAQMIAEAFRLGIIR